MRFLILNEVLAQDLIEIFFGTILIEILNEKKTFLRGIIISTMGLRP